MIKHNILVIAAHPDDEILGCCGTLLKYLANGSSVKIIYLSDGESSRDNINCQNINERKQQCLSALSVMGIEDFTFYDLTVFSKLSLMLFMIIGRVELISILIICKKFFFKT